MLQIIAWIGCVMLVLKGADIYLSSLLDEYSELRRTISFILLVVSVIVAIVFAVLIVRHVPETTPLIESHKKVQDSVQKSFDAISKELETTTAPAKPTPADEVVNSIRSGDADPAAGE